MYLPLLLSAALLGSFVGPGSTAASFSGLGGVPDSPFEDSRRDALPHDLHVAYGNLGVEGDVAILQIRIFKDDLEAALERFHEMASIRLDVSPEIDSLFMSYLRENFILEVGGAPLPGALIGSGDDELDREPVWWYQVQYRAPGPIEAARITNTVLFELFDDQRNVLRVVDFPSETRRAYYFARGEETVQIGFREEPREFAVSPLERRTGFHRTDAEEPPRPLWPRGFFR